MGARWVGLVLLASVVAAGQQAEMDRLRQAHGQVAEARRLLQSGAAEPALAAVNRARELLAGLPVDLPPVVDARRQLELLTGDAQRALGRPAEARAAYEAVLRDFADSAEAAAALLGLAQLAEQLGDPATALDQAARLAREYPDTGQRAEAERLLLEAELRQQRIDAAIARVDRLTAERASSMEAVHLLHFVASRVLELGQLDRAAALLERLRAQYPATRQAEEATRGLIQVRLRQGRPDDVVALARAALADHPERSAVAERTMALAQGLAARGDWEEALEALDKLGAEYRGTWVQFEAGQRAVEILMTRELPADALDQVELLLEELEPAYFRVPLLSYKLPLAVQAGKSDDALAAADELERLAPRDAQAGQAQLHALAMLLPTERRAEAIERLRRLAERYVGPPVATTAKRLLAEQEGREEP